MTEPHWKPIVHQKRLTQLHVPPQLTGCLTEVFFYRAPQRAKLLDEGFEITGRKTGPLHEVPVSAKDWFDVEASDTTVGWVGLANKPAAKSDPIVQPLETMGPVLYVMADIPYLSVNAFNIKLIPGGSSGGEGALVGTGGSVLGIGTDIGGSVRVPSNLQGLLSICRTTGRVRWNCSFMRQHLLVPPVTGPIARSLSIVEYFMQSLLDSNPWDLDPGRILIPWRINYGDGVVRAQPPTKSFLADGRHRCRHLCALVDEPLIQGMVVGIPADELSSTEKEKLEEEKYTLQASYLSQWGYKPKQWVQSRQWLGCSALYNLLNYAAVIAPIGKADKELDHPVSGIDERKGYAPRKKHDIDLLKGVPVTVQIVGGRFGKDRAVSVAKVVDGLLTRMILDRE
ncbi:amidase signature domain-containing protein [Aspergillus fruticulosus]